MISVPIVVTILFAHLVSDFFAQTDWMVKNKSSSNYALNRHVLVYSLTLFAIFSILTWYAPSDILLVVAWAGLNGVIHWIVDFMTSRISSHYYGIKKRSAFFNTIGVDQFIHGATLVVTAYLLLS